jgi:Xaa-Pro aminopeptidase
VPARRLAARAERLWQHGTAPVVARSTRERRSVTNVRFDRIARVQARMREERIVAIVVMNHDDYRWLFGADRSQPRAIIPVEGPVDLVAFSAEEPELTAAIGDERVRVFRSVGGQIHEVVDRLREIADEHGPALGADPPRVGMQMWFETPAFLVDRFRQVNPKLELVSSDPVMDPLRGIKDDGELRLMTEAQRIAGLGMDRVRELLRPGVTAHELATEALYAMMRAGAEGTSTPLWITFGVETCMLHGRRSPAPLERGQLVVADLTPQVEGYCANLARTFVLGEPDETQARLLAAYADIRADVRAAMVPGARVADLDGVARAAAGRHGLADRFVDGIGHGLGLRFEETPASTIIPPHRNIPLREGMTVTIGHPVLAIPGVGGARFEDVYRVTPDGGAILFDYPLDPLVRA